MDQIFSAIRQCPCFGGTRKQGKVRLTDEEAAPAVSLSVTQEAGAKPIHIAVMGPTGSGKSTFVNLVSGSSLGVGKGLESCTSEVQVSNPFDVDGRQVVLIDTPGFGDTTLADSDIWKIIAASFVASYRAGIRLTGVIYMQRISDVKVSGSARQSFRMFQELCGEETFPNVLLVTGMWDAVSQEVGLAREEELKSKEIFFRPVLDRGASVTRHDNTRASATAIVRTLLDRPPVTLRIQRELAGGDVDVMQTSVYRQIREVMAELVAQCERKLDTLMAEMAEAEQSGDEETREELAEEVGAARTELAAAEDKMARLSSAYAEELQRLEETVRRG